ncbi:Nucleic acid-binding protein [Corchorus capsularis]|uniref:Nucleic acid-binding protein n=1 Tax=Corchorus capsularis TaxID=210143 RepID=A0A1R3HI51_COCAP|nr:Nucleic acid-binding protein [Corchorus capsularis]
MADIITRSEKDPIFTDAIGMFVGYGEPVGVPVDSGARTTHKVDVNIRLLSDQILRVSFWVSHIQHFNLAELAAMSEKPIFAMAGTTVRSYSSTKYLCSSSSTKVYVNPDIREAHEIRERFKNDKTLVALLTSDQASQSTASANAKDITIFQLLYLDLNRAQGQKFRVEVEITEVVTTNGWYYECCSDCPLKVQLAEGDKAAKDLEVTVFGPLAKNLIGVNLAREVFERGVYPKKLPSTAKDVVGTKFLFILGISDQTLKRGSPSIPADLFVETSPLKKIKQEPTPNEHSRDQDQPDSDSQVHQNILEKINQESSIEERSKKQDHSDSHTQNQQRTVARGAKDKQV